MMVNVDYLLLARAIEYYKNLGFEQIEVPWLVSLPSILQTYKSYKGRFTIPSGDVLIGSAEQGFIEILDSLEDSMGYMSVSPCFRDDKPSDIHQTQFLKLELFSKNPQEYMSPSFIAGLAKDLFESEGVSCIIEKTGIDSCDIETLDGVELGSYGYDNNGDDIWLYGTGLALPRFSIVM